MSKIYLFSIVYRNTLLPDIPWVFVLHEKDDQCGIRISKWVLWDLKFKKDKIRYFETKEDYEPKKIFLYKYIRQLLYLILNTEISL